MREYIATAMRLGEPCQTVEEPKNTLQPKAKADGAKMKSIAPALGPGLGVGAAGEESRLCPQPGAAEKGEGRADVPLLDDVVGYAPALLLSEGSQDDALAQRSAEQQQQWPRHLHNRRRVRTPTPHLSVAFGLTCWLRLGQMVSFIREGRRRAGIATGADRRAVAAVAAERAAREEQRREAAGARAERAAKRARRG